MWVAVVSRLHYEPNLPSVRVSSVISLIDKACRGLTRTVNYHVITDKFKGF